MSDTGPEQPSGIALNEATGNDTEVRLTNAFVADNMGFTGGGLGVADLAEIYMSTHYINERTLIRYWSPGACSQIVDNEATLGGGVEILTGSYALIDETVFQQNQANIGTAIFARSESGSTDISVLDLSGYLVTNNEAGGVGDCSDLTAITLTGAQAFITYTTMADNEIESSVIGSGANGLLDINLSIMHQTDGVPTYLAFNPSNLSSANCVMVSTINDFNEISIGLSVDDPLFVNRSLKDFHLSDISPAIDTCFPLGLGSPILFDLDEEVRGWDDPDVSNFPKGPQTFDISYDENIRFIEDLIFLNGFEEGS